MNITKERHKLFKNKAKDLYSSLEKQECFLVGAVWVEQHPRKGLVDVEKACDWVEQHASEYCGRSEYMAEDLRKAILEEE